MVIVLPIDVSGDIWRFFCDFLQDVWREFTKHVAEEEASRGNTSVAGRRRFFTGGILVCAEYFLEIGHYVLTDLRLGCLLPRAHAYELHLRIGGVAGARFWSVYALASLRRRLSPGAG